VRLVSEVSSEAIWLAAAFALAAANALKRADRYVRMTMMCITNYMTHGHTLCSGCRERILCFSFLLHGGILFCGTNSCLF
jgi:hypothetical protein